MRQPTIGNNWSVYKIFILKMPKLPYHIWFLGLYCIAASKQGLNQPLREITSRTTIPVQVFKRHLFTLWTGKGILAVLQVYIDPRNHPWPDRQSMAVPDRSRLGKNTPVPHQRRLPLQENVRRRQNSSLPASVWFGVPRRSTPTRRVARRSS